MSMNNSVEEGIKLRSIVLHGSLIVRIVGVYLWVYLFLTATSLFFLETSNMHIHIKALKNIVPGFIHPSILVSSIPAFLIIVFLEFTRKRYSKKYNLPRWKDSTEILAEREYKKQKLEEEEYMKKQAKINLEVTKQNSLDYWFDFKQKGAITSDEYDKKKNELLSK